ncbi:MAG TPA: response regulator [Planctomycetota bacterium]|jgi:DNA-binding response OmpR family regulator|nr:response regulator [Planctomycetota bacterium]
MQPTENRRSDLQGKKRQAQEGGRTYRVLLAEDDREMRTLLAWELEDKGFEVVEATDGIDLLKHMAPILSHVDTCSRFDVIVSDIRMPGLTGMEILAGLRKRDKLTPVILITAFGDDITHAEAEELGASAMLDKPFDTGDLVTTIRRFLVPRTHNETRAT